MRTKTMFVLLLCLPLLASAMSSQPANQAQPRLQANCKAVVGVKTLASNVMLNVKHDQQHHQPQIYLLQNRSTQQIILDHPVSNPGASAGWSSLLAAGHWSAILLDRSNFELSCNHIKKAGGVISLSCHQVLQVCQLAGYTLPNKQTGSYWYVENKSFAALMHGIEKRMGNMK